MIKVSIVAREKVGGVEYHRLEIPFVNMVNDYDVSFTNLVSGLEFKPDLVIANRTISLYGFDSCLKEIEYLKTNNIPYILDLDDYWVLGKDHILHQHYKDLRMAEQILVSIINASCVWVTNEVLADKVKQHNSNVIIVPNAIDFNQPQFKLNRKTSGPINVGWSGSTTHVKDVEILEQSFRQLHRDKSLMKRYKVLMAGWHHEVNEMLLMEKSFTGNYKATPGHYERIPAVDVYNYANHYNHFDIALCPLVDNTFNNCKSFLKALEAGAKGCAVIASNVHPYNDLLVHGETAILIDKHRNEKGWYNEIKKLINNPLKIKELSLNLHNVVKENYNIKTINIIRKQSIKELCK